ncbi:hypothetical protein PINS_up008156 [Pythium insidiosum]|nr:hypothetical protein PINS_up008156 [Pythium insidiosum]
MVDHQLAQRMMQRQHPSRLASLPSMTTNPASVTSRCKRHLQFHEVCRELFYSFDPQVQRTGELPLDRLHLLLRHYDLRVDDVAYRQWEQTLPQLMRSISLSAFVAACTQWFGERGLLGHYERWKQRTSGSTANATRGESSCIARSASAPQLLHPFESMQRKQDDAAAFSYRDFVKQPPVKTKTKEETVASKRDAVIHATQQLRRQTKILSRLDSTSTLSPATPSSATVPNAENASSGTSPLPSSSSASQSSSPSLASPSNARSSSPPPLLRASTHSRLHDEKLARHILERCAEQSLAPSHHSVSAAGSATDVASPASPLQSVHARVREEKRRRRAAKQARQRHVETTRAFATSIAMIARHVQNEELRDLRELEFERQIAIVDDRKQLRRVQRAHCDALAREKSQQQLRVVHAMKTVAKEEVALSQQFWRERAEQRRAEHAPFELSAASSTLFQQPPEILAAKATAKTGPQRRRLRMLEKEHIEHMRSVQLLDYAYDRRRALLDATQPKAEAALVELDEQQELPAPQSLALASEELWRELLDDCVATGDLSPLLPPANSPPAALRFFGSSRPVLLPPFVASTVTPSPISKVP